MDKKMDKKDEQKIRSSNNSSNGYRKRLMKRVNDNDLPTNNWCFFLFFKIRCYINIIVIVISVILLVDLDFYR